MGPPDRGHRGARPYRREHRHLPSGEHIILTGDNIASLGGKPILGPFNVARHGAIDSFRKLATMDVDIACFERRPDRRRCRPHTARSRSSLLTRLHPRHFRLIGARQRATRSTWYAMSRPSRPEMIGTPRSSASARRRSIACGISVGERLVSELRFGIRGPGQHNSGAGSGTVRPPCRVIGQDRLDEWCLDLAGQLLATVPGTRVGRGVRNDHVVTALQVVASHDERKVAGDGSTRRFRSPVPEVPPDVVDVDDQRERMGIGIPARQVDFPTPARR